MEALEALVGSSLSKRSGLTWKPTWAVPHRKRQSGISDAPSIECAPRGSANAMWPIVLDIDQIPPEAAAMECVPGGPLGFLSGSLER